MSSREDPEERSDVYRAIETLQRLAEVFDWRREQLASAAGLSDAQWRVLEQIASDDFMPSLFARSRACSPAAVSRTLRQLQERGLVGASISAHDGRQRDYRLTARGRKLLARIQTRREDAIDAVWSHLDPEDLRRFARVGADLAGRLEAHGSADSPRGGGKPE